MGGSDSTSHVQRLTITLLLTAITISYSKESSQETTKGLPRAS